MSKLFDWEHGVMAISIICQALLLWHLYAAGLSRYRWLKGLLAVELAQSLALMPFSLRSTTYAVIYFASSPVVWTFFYLVLIELVNLILEDFPGVSTTVRKGFSYALCAAVVVSGILAIPGLEGSATYRILHSFAILQRSVILALLILLAMTIGVLFYFRVPLSPNRKKYAIGYGLYFAIGVAANLIISELGTTFATTLNLCLVLASSAVPLSGVFLLRRDGEAIRMARDVGVADDRNDEKLYRQLEELNRLLTRVGSAAL